MEQARSAGVQALEKTAESRSNHPREGKRTERARLETNGCILSGVGTPKSEFRLIKDLVLLGVSLWTAAEALSAASCDCATDLTLRAAKS